MKQSRGFTLVELMIVVAIVGILATTTFPVGRAWVSEAKVTKVRGELAEAIGKAKGVAIRNQNLATGNAPVTALCIGDIDSVRTLAVYEQTAAASPSCTPSGDLIWSTPVSDDVTIEADADITLSCACFDGSGLITTATGCNACVSPTNVSITLTSGAESESMFVH